MLKWINNWKEDDHVLSPQFWYRYPWSGRNRLKTPEAVSAVVSRLQAPRMQRRWRQSDHVTAGWVSPVTLTPVIQSQPGYSPLRNNETAPLAHFVHHSVRFAWIIGPADMIVMVQTGRGGGPDAGQDGQRGRGGGCQRPALWWLQRCRKQVNITTGLKCSLLILLHVYISVKCMMYQPM